MLNENQKNGHSGINLYQMNQILLEDDSLLDPNIHYSQICDDDSLRRPSFLKHTDSSHACNLEEFDEEIKIKECNLKPIAHTLFGSNGDQTNLIVPQLELVLKTKNFTDNSVDEESIKMTTSPTFQTAKIGTNGKNENGVETFDISAQLSQIHQNSMSQKNTLNEINFRPEFVSDKIDMTHKSSYRSLSQLELYSKNNETLKNNIVNFSAFFSQKEKNTNNEINTNKTYEEFDLNLNLNESKVNDKTGINNYKSLNEEPEKIDEISKIKGSFGFHELEERLKQINHTLRAKKPIDNNNNNSSVNPNKNEENKNDNPIIESSFNQISQKPIKENEIMISNENRQSEPSEVFEKPTVFRNLEKPINEEQINSKSNEKIQKTEEAIFQNVSNEENLRNLNFFLSLEKSIKEEGDRFRNDKILNNNLVEPLKTVPIPKDDISNKEIQSEKEKDHGNSEIHAILLQNKKELDALILENKEEIIKNASKHDIDQLPLRFEPKKQSINNNWIENGTMNKIADSFKEIAATISETIHKHKIEIEKDCDLSVFKNFLTKVREHSNERLNNKYFAAGEFAEPEDKINPAHNSSQELSSNGNYLSPNIKSINLSYKINKMKL